MYTYPNGDLRDSSEEERIVANIRDAALQKVQKTHPEIEYVIDRRTIDDYCHKQWDYPGAWYSRGFKLPDGFKNKDELIDAIADETIRFFAANQ